MSEITRPTTIAQVGGCKQAILTASSAPFVLNKDTETINTTHDDPNVYAAEASADGDANVALALLEWFSGGDKTSIRNE